MVSRENSCKLIQKGSPGKHAKLGEKIAKYALHERNERQWLDILQNCFRPSFVLFRFFAISRFLYGPVSLSFCFALSEMKPYEINCTGTEDTLVMN